MGDTNEAAKFEQCSHSTDRTKPLFCEQCCCALELFKIKRNEVKLCHCFGTSVFFHFLSEFLTIANKQERLHWCEVVCTDTALPGG